LSSSEADVVARPVLADEVLLEQQRLRLGLRDERLDVLDFGEEAARAARRGVREVARHALADRLRLAHVQHAPVLAAEQVDAGESGSRDVAR